MRLGSKNLLLDRWGTKIVLPWWLGLSCLDNPVRTKVNPLFLTFTDPSPSCRCCKSLYLLNVVIAMRKQVFQVTNFKGASYYGSKGAFWRQPKTRRRFYSGRSFLKGGRSLKTPLSKRKRIMKGWRPIGIVSTGAITDDNMDLYPFIVLYLRPFSNK